jgi:DNA-binding MarR family transcriptional regulator
MPEQTEVPASSAQLVEQIMRFTKSIHRMKIALTKEVPDRAAYGLLYPLVESDKRAADLADIVHSDPSTVSRHISQLVANELVQRVPDQHDGRSALLSLTEKGRGLCGALMKHRANALVQAVSDWSEDDTAMLTNLLTRLNDDMDTRHQDILDGFRNVYDAAEADNAKPTKEHA